MRALLDVNVLLAARDEGHVQDGRARFACSKWRSGGASCPLTQNGCVRIMSQPSYPAPVKVSEIIGRLREATAHPSHTFWPDDISVLDDAVVDAGRVHGPKQVTDLYLLALAVHRGGRFVTFDARIPLSAVRGAKPEHLLSL